MNLAVIPARGGSKRIPRKNIRLFSGKPIIAYSIDAAISSGLFDRIVVSTDDQEIADVAQSCGADVPFMRPPELADDSAETLPVVRHAIESLQGQGTIPQYVCCIYATAPFLTAANLHRGLAMLRQTGAEYAFSVTTFPSPIQRAVKITPSGRITMFQPENFHKRSQDLEEAYHDAAQFYWGRSSAFLAAIPLFSEQAAPVPLPRYQVQDLDTLEDWSRAELMFRAWHKDCLTSSLSR